MPTRVLAIEPGLSAEAAEPLSSRSTGTVTP